MEHAREKKAALSFFSILYSCRTRPWFIGRKLVTKLFFSEQKSNPGVKIGQLKAKL